MWGVCAMAADSGRSRQGSRKAAARRGGSDKDKERHRKDKERQGKVRERQRKVSGKSAESQRKGRAHLHEVVGGGVGADD